MRFFVFLAVLAVFASLSPVQAAETQEHASYELPQVITDGIPGLTYAPEVQFAEDAAQEMQQIETAAGEAAEAPVEDAEAQPE